MAETSTASVGETPAIKALCEEYKNLNPKYIALEARIKHIKKELKKLSKGKEILSVGVSVKTSTRKGNVDYSKIKGIQKMTEDGSIDKYRKASSKVTTVKVVG